MIAKQQEDKGFEQKFVTGPVVLNNILINPTLKELIEWGVSYLKEEPKYNDTKDGVITAMVSIWGKSVDEEIPINWKIFLTNKELISSPKDGSSPKKAYINEKGTVTWTADTAELKDWFTSCKYRPALQGEEKLAAFVAAFNNTTFKDMKVDSVLLEEPAKLFKGDFSELRQFNSFTTNKVMKLVGIVEKNDRFYQMIEDSFTLRHWQKDVYLYESIEKKGKVTLSYLIDYITNYDPNNKFKPSLMSDEPRIWTIAEVKKAYKEITTGEVTEEVVREIPITYPPTDDLSF